MIEQTIITESGKLNEYLHHIDLMEYGLKGFLSCYLVEFDEGVMILDCGSSLCVSTLLKYLGQNHIALSSILYLTTTHHHYDHVGGLWMLYDEIKKHNPQVKILTNNLTKDLLIDYEYHLHRARRNFGDFVGEMRPIDEAAFNIIQPLNDFNTGSLSNENIMTFTKNGREIKFSVINTPGHTPDHQCPLFINDEGVVEFLFLGEAAGTLYNSSELISMPTSMAVYFQHEQYMTTLQKLQKLKPIRAGLGHFGVINGMEYVTRFVHENEIFMEEFRRRIVELYQHEPNTSHVVNNIVPYLVKRTDRMNEDSPILRNIVLGTVYGMMIDLGYRSA